MPTSRRSHFAPTRPHRAAGPHPALPDPRCASAAALHPGQEGYALLAVLVAVFLVLLTLSVAAPTVARALRREREVETVHRADQYTRAIQLYYRKFGHYPGSLEQLEKSNEIRFLREKYTDPMTGKADWRLIKVGQNKTTVKGFFGQPLGGIASTGLGSAGSLASPGGTGTPAGSSSSPFGGSSPTGMSSGADSASAGSSFGGSSFGGSSIGGSSTGGSSVGSSTGSSFGATDASSGSSGTNGGTGISSQSTSGLSGTNSPFLGVGLPISGNSIITVNEKNTYPEWEFLYDPRIEQLRAKVNILGGGMSSTGASSLGSADSLNSNNPTSSSPNSSSPTSSSPFGSPSSSPSSSPFGSPSSSPGSSPFGSSSPQ